jgi:cobalt-zinc-cadmium efflux system membrane fusion protein
MYRAMLSLASVAATALSSPAPGFAKDVRLSAEQVSRLEIKLQSVQPTSSELVAVLPATVVCPPNSHVVATAPYGGTVVQVLVLPGQAVKKGDLLARVSSRELLEAQSQIAQAEAELQNAAAIAKRQRYLADKQLKSVTMAEEAEAQVAKFKAVVDRHKRTLALNGIVPGDGGQYAIPATHDGTVVEIDIMPGDRIDAMGAVVSLDTSEDLWAEVQVPSDIVAKVKVGDPVKLASGEAGRVLSVGSNLDAKTRSALLYAELPNDTAMLPGQMISLSLLRTASAEGFSVPAGSVTRVDNQNIVFVRTADGFAAKPVSLLAKSQAVATISGDLPPNAEVASSGIPALERLLSGK